MNARWRILAQIDLLHDYYADGKCPDFGMVPSAATAQRMSESRLLAKVVENKLLVLVPVDETGKPAVAVPSDLRLVFHLELANTGFLAVSNVDATALRSRRFHFSNVTGNAVGAGPGAVLNLSRPIPAYDNAAAYVPGDLVRSGLAMHENFQASTGQAPPNGAFWVARGTTQYASKADLIPFKTRIAEFTVATPARAFRILIHGLNPATNDYDLLLREQVVVTSALEAGTAVQADLSALPAGRYRLDINGEIFEAWFDDEAASRGSFGVIEILNHLPRTDVYSLVDAADQVREVTYAIRFANRRAYWKYVTTLRKVADIRPSADHALPSPFVSGSDNPALPSQKDWFQSLVPLPLSEAPGDNLFDLMLEGETRPAPKPDPRQPGMLTQTFHAPSGTYRDNICTIRLNQ